MKRRIFIFMLVISFSYFMNVKAPAAASSKNMDIFNEIVKCADGKIIEYGVDLAVDLQNLNDSDIDRIGQKVNECYNAKISKIHSDDTYCININGKNINGYIESAKQSSGYNVRLELIIKDNKNNIDNLINEVKNTNLFKNNGVKIFRYMKAKVSDDISIENINNKIINYLKGRYADNINSIKLDNSYNITAYTGNEDYIMAGNKAVDVTISVSRYTSGNYIIIGTPEIIISY